MENMEENYCSKIEFTNLRKRPSRSLQKQQKLYSFSNFQEALEFPPDPA